MNQYVYDFSKLPLSLVYVFEEREDQISTLNKLFTVCLESHAPTGRVKLTHPIPPWMKDPTIVSDRQKLELSRIHFFVKCCHPKILKVYRILLIVYSINNKKQ